jgi:uncharacterized membrane protein YccC
LVATARARDPDGYALRRAIRVAIVAPAAFALSFKVIGNPEIATFTVFGCFALLLFVDFPGDRATRLIGYLMLSVIGAVLIALGTLASRATWLAAVGMAVVAFFVLFAGVLSAPIAAASRAALLLFILPVTLRVPVGDIVPRLLGWALAVGISVPAAMLVWPPHEHDALRRHASDTCRALADVIVARETADDDYAAASCARVVRSLDGLRAAFRSTAYRPVGLTTGSRVLIRLVEQLEWLGSIAASPRAARLVDWPRLARVATSAAADVLRASADMLAVRRDESLRDRGELDEAMSRLITARRAVAAETRAILDPAVQHAADLPYQGHELAYAATLVGTTVTWAAEADARPLFDWLLGRGGDIELETIKPAPLSPPMRIATSQLHHTSVWLRNSVRGALGLGLAVLVSRLAGTQHAFWVALGALAVLRSNALSTGSTAVRALVGTVLGFAIGGFVIAGIGTVTPVLWALLPIAVLIASYAPEAISFTAGQAGFTAVLLVLFNILAPVGWTLGLVRVEDVALGSASSFVVGVLLWPRGAAAAIGTALGEAYRLGADYIDHAVAHALRGAPAPAEARDDVLAAGRRLDDALRQYLAERGAKTAPLRELTAAANGATRLRLAGEAITLTRRQAKAPGAVGRPLIGTLDLVTEQATSVADWYVAFARGGAFDEAHRVDRLPPPPDTRCFIDATLASLRRDLASSGSAGSPDNRPTDESAEQARRLLWTSLYLEDLRVLATRLTERPLRADTRSVRAG